jgi:Tol biopolymer transport system component
VVKFVDNVHHKTKRNPSMAENNLERLLKQGIAAAKQGNNATARGLLEAVIAQDDTNELAWIWLASTVSTVRERRFCLEKVLQINPNNTRARDALNALVGVGSQQNARNVGDLTRAAANAVESGQTGGEGALSLNNPYVRIGLVVATVVFVGLALAPLLQRPAAQITPTAFSAFLASPTPNSNFTPTPLPSPTFNGIIVTRAGVDQLPPTFTPTFTPSPTETPLPTATPYPFNAFMMVAAETDASGKTVLYRYAGDGTGQVSLAEDAREVSFSRDGQHVTFIRDVSYPAEGENPEATVGEVFYATLTDVANAQQLTTLRTHSARHPRFSPNGQQVIFNSDYDGDDELWLIDINSKTTTQITYNSVSDRDAEFSPDGTRLIFASDRNSPGLPDLYLLTFVQNPTPPDPSVDNDSGHTVIRLADLIGASYSPTWSPDGSQIAFINDQEGDGDIYMMTADGQRVIALNVATDVEDNAPAWTPDGRRVGFVSNRENDRFQVYAVDVQSREVTRLLQDERDVQNVAFQPNAAFRLP